MPDVDRPQISPVLFLTVDGEPMTFYLRPGPAKCELQPLIKAGGGVLSGVQKPGAVLLTDPEERGAIPAQSAHWYVSTQYIRDCVEKDEQLELEDYRLNPETVRSGSPKPTQSKAPSAALTTGRSPYTPEEDVAILKYVSKHKDEVGGNRLWQQMETQRVTTHSWQSMKARYKGHLAQRLAGFEATAGGAAEEEDKDGNTDQETAEQKPGEEAAAEPESADHPRTDSSETQVDITAETDAPNMNTPAKSIKLEIRPVSISGSSKADGTSLIPPTDEQQPSENPRAGTAEAGARGSPPPPADGPARSTDPETDRSETDRSQSLEEESPSEPLFSSPAPKKSKQRDADTPTEIRTRRRSLRRQPELELNEPYGKKLRSSLPFVEKPTVATRRSNLPRKSAHQKDTAVDEQPVKRARGRSAAPESAQLESAQLESAQLESSQLESSQLETPQVETPQVESQQLESSQLETPQLESQQMESSQLESPQLESPQLESPQLESPQLESPQLESQQLESQQLESSQLESQQMDNSQLETPQLETPQLETPQLESQQVESQQLESSQLESQQLESQQLETPQLESQQLETPQLESSQLESQQLEIQQLETPQLESQQLEAEGGDDPEPAGKEAKKTEKRKLGIFELATKEFDDDSEDEGQSLQTGAAPAEPQPASSEEEPPQCSSAALTRKDPEPEPQPGPSLQQQQQQQHQQQQQQVPEARTPRGPHPPCRTGDASEEEESQSIISAGPAEKNQPAASEGQELLPTQIQLEEDKQRITELMNRSKQDLDSVVKALLKTSGDFAAALDLLLDPSSSSSSGPIWSRRDDELLMSGDRNVHQQLLKEFGEEGVAKRRRFLDEGSV